MKFGNLIVVIGLLSCLVMEIEAVSVHMSVKYPSKNIVANGQQPELSIRGDALGLNWTQGIGLNHVDSDEWEIVLETEKVGTTLQFKVLVEDKTWQIGANQVLVVPNEDKSVTLFPWFYTEKGSLGTVHGVVSPQLNNTRDVAIYYPASYFENTYKTIQNVLIMHDGNNLFGQNCSSCCPFGCWMAQDTIDLYTYEGQMEEVFVVGPYNNADRLDEYTYSYDPSVPGGGKGDLYLDFIQDTLMPQMVKQFRIASGYEHTGMLGSSLGGLISCYAGWTRPTLYSKIGCMSSSFWWNKQDFLNTVMPKHENPVPRLDAIYLDSGNAGPGKDDVTETIAVRGLMEKLGYTLGKDLFYFLDQGGQHNEHFWGDRFWRPMVDLYPVKPVQFDN